MSGAGYFNPRSREGSDPRQPGHPRRAGISIHAPVKGATPTRGTDRVIAYISIHAPVKGATI